MKEPIIYDTSDGQQLRINMISPWLKRYFRGEDPDDKRTLKIVKLSLDGGFTCPNRDGTKGTGGCLFCSESGSGDMASSLYENRHVNELTSGTSPINNALNVGESETNEPGDNELGENEPGTNKPETNESGRNESQTNEPRACKPETNENAGIRAAIRSQMKLLSDKWPSEKYNLKFIAYFQNHTNTYGPVRKLRSLFEAAIEQDEICGLAIATRPDCISEEVLQLLEELNGKTFLWVELGLQTIHDNTAKAMNLCHAVKDYDDASIRLTERNIRVVTHLILGLPGENREMMLESVRHACRAMRADGNGSARIFGLKLHMLNVVKGSGMEKQYRQYVPFETMEEYVDLLIEALEIIPPEITMHRISGDAPRATLIAPEWSYRKRTILNLIHRTMKERNTWQGKATGTNKEANEQDN